ncbi:MAG: hypothetical protein CMK07_16910 [Ponticaulis sp.]|nr:hypothetical protein [Ponticaulis sp.]
MKGQRLAFFPLTPTPLPPGERGHQPHRSALVIRASPATAQAQPDRDEVEEQERAERKDK